MISPFQRRAGSFGGVIVALVLTGVMAGASIIGAAQQSAGGDRGALRSRIEPRYDIVPLKDGIGLRPRARDARIRMIEISDGTIAIDGVAVSGRELRERVGADADFIIPLSYYDAAERRAFLGQREERPADVAPAERAPERGPDGGRRRRVGERVRVFGSVTIPRDESVEGQVVAVLGSVRVDGHVSDQVVAVLGSVDLGPDAVVDGDIVTVGGSVRRADTARVGGQITEVTSFAPGIRWWPWPVAFGMFGGTARLFGTLFRLFLLGLLGSIAVLLAQQPVERIGQRVATEPIKMAIIGVLAELLFFPALTLTVLILAVSIVGIPLLLIVPFVVVALLFVFLGGFVGAAYVAGGWAAARAGWNADQPYARVWLGVLVVLTPLLVARLFGLMGDPFYPAAVMIAGLALMFEYVVWTTGFGAALATAFERWRTTRAAVQPAPPVG